MNTARVEGLPHKRDGNFYYVILLNSRYLKLILKVNRHVMY